MRSGFVFLAGLLLALVVALAGCGDYRLFVFYRVEPTATPTPQPTPTLVVLSLPTPTPQPTPVFVAPEPAPILVPSVTREEAETTVRAYFQALEAEDELRLAELTAGEAADTTRAIVDEVRRQEQGNGADITARTRRLDFGRDEARETALSLETFYAVEITARLGFFNVPVRVSEGTAYFVVARVEGQPRVVRIEGDLP